MGGMGRSGIQQELGVEYLEGHTIRGFSGLDGFDLDAIDIRSVAQQASGELRR
jgi:hypothetical protein